MNTLREMLDFASDLAETRFNVVGRLWAMWHAVRENGEHLVIPGPIGATKDQTAAAARLYFKQQRVVRYVFIDEAWTIEIAGGKSMAEAEAQANAWLTEHGSLANHPQRREIVTFLCEDATGMLTAEREIIRKVNSRARLGPLRLMDSRESSGRFVGMLPRLESTLQ
jgi:hypothetical protein